MTGSGNYGQPNEQTSAPDRAPSAAVSSAKPQTIREFENALHGLGFSRRESRVIAERGFKAARTAGDESEECAQLDELARLLRSNVALLKGP